MSVGPGLKALFCGQKKERVWGQKWCVGFWTPAETNKKREINFILPNTILSCTWSIELYSLAIVYI